ncbi:hypothetical protein [Xiamenia xianingshaonis]|uniref:hypothetical protein n=1 Tax=Xiamenia xianingshaonis TaxID=2682776 RepID=UPI0014077362|nr:hypothetical protein [Xiamenia xianingshaonis]
MHSSRSKLRTLNGIVAAVLVAAFFGHALFGVLRLHGDFAGQGAWLVWIVVGLMGAHVGLSAATSRSMLADEQRPPSTRKKRHLALKWVSGAALLAVALFHMAFGLVGGAEGFRIVLLAVLVLLAWHCLVGVKSLLKDLGLPKELRGAVRTLLAVAAAVLAFLLFC